MCEVMDISEVLCTLYFYIVTNAANLIWVAVMSYIITNFSCFLLHIETGCFRRNLPYCREMFLVNYINITKHFYIQNSMVMEIMVQ